VPTTLHLVRHGEVHNPDHVVYADLDGFGLSGTGRLQAAAAAGRLATGHVDVLVSSPLQRAVETAQPIAGALDLEPVLDERLTEWGLGRRWAGVGWDDLPDRFPGELDAYLATPTDLAFAPESLSQVAARMEVALSDAGRAHPGGTVVLISHQDPIQALRLSLTGRPLRELHTDKPGHASVITLERSSRRWIETAVWTPQERSAPFPPVKDRRDT
jgi:broad specificity phosphatase PhoE